MYIIPIDNESYQEYINRIIESRENVKNLEYMERHHIVPKCLNGSDDDDNLIYLYAQEHYYAHKLLAMENPDNIKLVYAWWNMCQCTQNGMRVYQIDADEYAEARYSFSNSMKNNKYALGQKLGEDTRKKMSDSHKGRLCGELNPMYGKHCGDHCKQLLHDKLSGKSNPSARKVKCVETNEIFDTATDAAKYYGFSHSDIAACIAGRQKSAGKDKTTGIKLHWIYIE